MIEIENCVQERTAEVQEELKDANQERFHPGLPLLKPIGYSQSRRKGEHVYDLAGSCFKWEEIGSYFDRMHNETKTLKSFLKESLIVWGARKCDIWSENILSRCTTSSQSWRWESEQSSLPLILECANPQDTKNSELHALYIVVQYCMLSRSWFQHCSMSYHYVFFVTTSVQRKRNRYYVMLLCSSCSQGSTMSAQAILMQSCIDSSTLKYSPSDSDAWPGRVTSCGPSPHLCLTPFPKRLNSCSGRRTLNEIFKRTNSQHNCGEMGVSLQGFLKLGLTCILFFFILFVQTPNSSSLTSLALPHKHPHRNGVWCICVGVLPLVGNAGRRRELGSEDSNPYAA